MNSNQVQMIAINSFQIRKKLYLLLYTQKSTLNTLRAHIVELPDFLLSSIVFILFPEPLRFSAPIFDIKKLNNSGNQIVFVYLTFKKSDAILAQHLREALVPMPKPKTVAPIAIKYLTAFCSF